MHIGKAIRELDVEPIKAPRQEPRPETKPAEKERELVPA